MGRITIFTEDGCEGSLALRSLLFDNSIPFHDISLSEHPERRQDMITLTNDLSTPQIFFNSLHIGGLPHLEEIFALYEKEALVKEHNGPNGGDQKDESSTNSDDGEDVDNGKNEQESTSSQDLSNNPILDRINLSVLNQQSPNHESKLRLQPMNYRSSRYQDLKYEYESWNERLKENDVFYLRHGDGEERLSISNVTRSLMKCSSPSSDQSSSPQVSLPHYKIYDHYLKTGKVHKKCFKGKDAISVLKKEYKFLKTDNDTIAFGQTLLNLGILHCVFSKTDDNDGAHFEDEGEEGVTIHNFSANGIYRLQPYHSTEIKNKFRLWSRIDIVDKYDPGPLLTLSRLSKMLHAAIEKCSSNSADNDNKSDAVDYSIIQNSELFMSFEETLCLLQLTNLDVLSNRSRLTFFINVYNLMVKHAIVLQLDPCKASFYSKDIRYMIGECIYSLDDIYHGILRCNSKHPKTGKEMFSSKPTSPKMRIDPRDKYKCPTVNPRIHFALISNYINNCDEDDDDVNIINHSNSDSKNPHHHLLTTKYYHEFHHEAVNSELFIIAQRSCKEDGRIIVMERKNTLNLPKFIGLYLDDFMGHNWNGDINSHIQELPKVMAKYFIGEKRELLENMIKERPDKIYVTFQDKDRPKSLVRRGLDCLPMVPWNHHAQRKKMRQSKLFGSFPQSYPEDDEIQLLDKEEFGYVNPHNIPQEFDDCLSQSTGRSFREYRSNSWDVMSLDDCSSWSLSLTSWGELPTKKDIETHNPKNDQVWESFESISFSNQGMVTTVTSPSSPSGKKSEGQEAEQSRKIHTPPTPNSKKKNYLQSPSTVRTVSTTRGSPSSENFETLPTPTFFTATTPGGNKDTANILIMPKFHDDNSNFDENSDDEDLSYDTNGMETQNHDNINYESCSNPPKARRKAGLFKDKENTDDKTVSTKDIINLFFQTDLFDDMDEKDDDKKSLGSSSSTVTDNEYDSLSHPSKTLRQESITSLVSRDTHFEKLFNSSMASI